MYRHMQAYENDHRRLVAAIRDQCLARGLGGIKGLSTLFRCMDRDYNSSITLDEFCAGMEKFGVTLSQQDLVAVFKYFDKDKSGSIDFREFLEELRPPMAQCRIDVVEEAFDKMDAIKDGLLKVDDLKIVYREHAERHPKYLSGEWSLDEVLAQFLATFDDPDNKDGTVTPTEFLNYYAGVSSIIADDEYFDLMMRGCWGLPSVRKKSAGVMRANTQ